MSIFTYAHQREGAPMFPPGVFRYLETYGITPAGAYKDGADTWGSPWKARPGASALLALARAGDEVLTTLESFAGLADLLSVLQALQEKSVRLYLFCPGGLELDSVEDGARMFQAITMLRQLDRGLRCQTTSEGMQKRKRAGRRYCACPPYGLRWKGGRSVPDANERAVIERMLLWRADGHT